jgi:hypothetical protein
MAVVGVAQLTVRPGHWPDFIENMKQSKKILETCGARNVRLLAPLAGPEPSGTVAFTFEAEDLAAWGTINQTYYSDAAAMDLMTTATAPDGPVVSHIISVHGDVPLS